MKPALIYFMRHAERGVKIGMSRCVKTRRRDLSRQYGPMELLGIIAVHDGFNEVEAHRRFKSIHIHHEWFRIDTSLLCFIQSHAYPTEYQAIHGYYDIG